MDAESALAFAASAPFIAALVGLAKGWVPFERRVITPVCIALALAWGLILWASDRWDGDAAVFIVTGINVGFSASGMQSFAQVLAGRTTSTVTESRLPRLGPRSTGDGNL